MTHLTTSANIRNALMQGLVHIGLGNAAVATLIALAAWCVNQRVQRPALTHALCLLVLLKLLTPPLVRLPAIPAWLGHATTAFTAQSTDRLGAAAYEGVPVLPFQHSAEPASADLATAVRAINWSGVGQISVLVWIAGSIGWFVAQLLGALRLRAALKCATPAPDEVCELADQVARQLGLRRTPQLRVLIGINAPMLYGLGPRACIVLPSAVLQRLGTDAQTAILAHELGHFARRDHWVRMVELLATGLYWWHPAVWWTRRTLEAAEEQCCDALAVQHTARDAREYGLAILDVVDLAAKPHHRASLAWLHGGGDDPVLLKRMRVLANGGCAAAVSPHVRFIVAAAAVICLFCQPRWIDGKAPASDRLARATTPAESSVAPPPAWATAVSPDSRRLISVRPGYACELVDRSTGRVTSLAGHRISCVAFAPDSSSYVTGEIDGVVRLWDAASGKQRAVLSRCSAAIQSVDIAPQGDRIAFADDAGQLSVVDMAAATPVLQLELDSPIHCVRFAPDGLRAAVALGSWHETASGRVEIIDLAARRSVQSWPMPRGVGAIRFISPDAVLVADWLGRVEYRQLPDGQVMSSADVAKDLISIEAFSRDAEGLAAIGAQLQFGAGVKPTKVTSSDRLERPGA